MRTRATHTWKTTSGATVTATAELKLDEQLGADGWDCGSKSCCKYSFDIAVQGHGIVGRNIDTTPQTVGGVKYAASCGPLVISAANLAAIMTIVDEIKSHPAYIAEEAKEAASLKADQECHESTARVNRAMSM